jgi:hypothetical protein
LIISDSNNSTTLTDSANNAALTQLSPSNQSVRAVTDLNINKPNANFDPSSGSYGNVTQEASNGVIGNLYSTINSNQIDTNTATRLLSNRLNVDFNTAPILSNNPLTSTLGFDNWKTKQMSVGFKGRGLTTRFNNESDNAVVGIANDQPLRLYTGGDIGALNVLRSPY